MKKKLGLAEADPSSDIDGIDAKYKTLLLENYIFDKSYYLDEIINFGIRNIHIDDIKYASERNKTIKFISECDIDNAYVMPMFIDNSNPLSNCYSNYNAIDIHSDNLGSLTLVGQGASRYPTAHSIVLDIIDIINGSFLFKSSSNKHHLKNDIICSFYIRMKEISLLKDIIKDKINDNVIITNENSIKQLYSRVRSISKEMFICRM